MSRGTRAVLAAIALVLVAAVAAPVSATAATPGDGGGIGLRLVDVPAASSDDSRAQIYIVDHLAPGSVISRRIEVSNTTSAATSVALYPAAATIEDGAFLGAAGHTANELSTWTSVDPGDADVPADGLVTATVTISVPSDAAPGEQYGVVWAENRSASATGGGVTHVSRVGIRIYLSVGPGGPPAADFTIDALTAGRSPGGAPTIVATVHNTGGRALDMHGTLQLDGGPGGLSAGPFPARLGTTLAIDATERVAIALDEQLPAGPWEARITMHSGLLDRTAHATITFPDVGTSPAVDTTQPRSGPPLAALAAAVVVVGVAGLVSVRLRRRRRVARRHFRRPVHLRPA